LVIEIEHDAGTRKESNKIYEKEQKKDEDGRMDPPLLV